MKESAITIAIYNSSFIVFLCSVFFYGLVAIKHNGKRKNDFITSIGLLITSFGLASYFFWVSIWRDAHAARDASVWMIDHPMTWVSALMISGGSITILKGLTNDYWMVALFIGVTTFVFNLLSVLY